MFYCAEFKKGTEGIIISIRMCSF